MKKRRSVLDNYIIKQVGNKPKLTIVPYGFNFQRGDFDSEAYKQKIDVHKDLIEKIKPEIVLHNELFGHFIATQSLDYVTEYMLSWDINIFPLNKFSILMTFQYFKGNESFFKPNEKDKKFLGAIKNHVKEYSEFDQFQRVNLLKDDVIIYRELITSIQIYDNVLAFIEADRLFPKKYIYNRLKFGKFDSILEGKGQNLEFKTMIDKEYHKEYMDKNRPIWL